MTRPGSRERRDSRQERYAVSFAVTLMWQEKAGLVRRLAGRCVDLSPEGIQVEVRERMAPGTAVMVTSDEFGRMGFATVRHLRREKMQVLMGLRFATAFALGDPARKKVLAGVLRPDGTDTVTPPG